MNRGTENKIIIVDIPFNIDLSGYMLPKSYIHFKLKRSFISAQRSVWIDRRIELFMKYTCKSLLRQTNQDFICLLRCTPETEEYIYYVLKRYAPLPNNIRFSHEVPMIIDGYMQGRKTLYHVVIDSDNMYEKSFIERLKAFKAKPETQTIVCQEGYLYNETSNELATIFHESPSFYAAIYDNETYATLFHKRLFEKHWDAIKYPYEVIPGRNYCICTHNQNVDNAFRQLKKGYQGKSVEGEEKIKMFYEWGISG